MRRLAARYLFIILLSAAIAVFVQTVFVSGCGYRDSMPPTIHQVRQYPMEPEYEDSVLVLAYVTDSKSGVANVTLCYNVNGQEHIQIMNRTHDLYSAVISPQPYNSIVKYAVYAYDKAGNKACSKEYSYNVSDFHPPTVTFIERVPAQPNYNDTVMIVAKATEPVFASGVKELILSYTSDAYWTNVKMEFNGMLYNATMPQFPYGTTVHYKICVFDNAGNTAALDIYSYEVADSYLPVAAILAPQNGSCLSKSVGIALYVYDDNLHEAKLALDDTLLATWNQRGTHTYTLDTTEYSEGFHHLTIEARDRAGNIAKQKITLIVDNTAPKAEILLPLDGSHVRNNVLVKLHIEDVNFERMELKIGGYAYVWKMEDQTYIWNTIDYNDGLCEIVLTAFDKAGNKAEKRITVTVDNTAPVISNVFWNPTEPKTNETVKVSAQIIDSGSGIKSVTLWFRSLSGGWQQTAMNLEGGNWTGTIPGYGENTIVTFYVEGCDNAGNIAETLESYYIVKAAAAAGFPGIPLYWLVLIVLAIFAVLASIAYYIIKRRRGATVRYLAVSSL